MPIATNIVEAIKQIVAKSITVGAVYIIANNGLNMIVSYALGQDAVSPVEMKLLLLGASYVIWRDAIVPVVEDLFDTLRNKATGKATGAVGQAKKYFALV